MKKFRYLILPFAITLFSLGYSNANNDIKNSENNIIDVSAIDNSGVPEITNVSIMNSRPNNPSSEDPVGVVKMDVQVGNNSALVDKVSFVHAASGRSIVAGYSGNTYSGEMGELYGGEHLFQYEVQYSGGQMLIGDFPPVIVGGEEGEIPELPPVDPEQPGVPKFELGELWEVQSPSYPQWDNGELAFSYTFNENDAIINNEESFFNVKGELYGQEFWSFNYDEMIANTNTEISLDNLKQNKYIVQGQVVYQSDVENDVWETIEVSDEIWLDDDALDTPELNVEESVAALDWDEQKLQMKVSLTSTTGLNSVSYDLFRDGELYSKGNADSSRFVGNDFYIDVDGVCEGIWEIVVTGSFAPTSNVDVNINIVSDVVKLEEPTNNNEEGISEGAIAGIAVGSVAGVAVVGGPITLKKSKK